MAGLATTIYNTVFKRTSTFAATIIFASFFFERSFDMISEAIYEHHNKGKLWKDIKHKYDA